MITVVSANLWHDWPRQQRRVRRLESLARIVEREEVDVLLLQEVARSRRGASDAWLAGRLGMGVTYARGSGHALVGFEEGLAVLSRFPLRGSVTRRLDQGRSPLVRRLALAVELATPYGPVLVVSAHLGLLPPGNDRQLAMLRQWVDTLAAEGRTAIIGGDLNAPEGRGGIDRLREGWTDTFREQHPTADATTHASPSGLLRRVRPRRLDYVFVRQPAGPPWRVAAADHLHDPDEPHSDHRAVLARLEPPTDR